MTPGAAGPNRLDPDAAVLSTASPLRYAVGSENGRRSYTLTAGLEDLRLHDAGGTEHPYLLIAPSSRQPQWQRTTLRTIAASKTSSGFEADLGSVRNVDRVRIDGIATPFLKRLRLEGSGDRVHWSVLSPDATIFDLPDQQLRSIDIGFDPGMFRYLRVTWDDRASARVTRVGAVSARLYDATLPPVPARIAVPFRSMPSETGKSRYRITLPGAHLPVAAIEIEVTNANVYRDASVSEGRLNGSTVEPLLLGSSKLRRAERAEGVAEEMTIPIEFPQGPDLELVVDDGNNPSLSIRSINAVFAPLPWIYFESADGAALGATYGETAAKAPRYDLEARRRAATTAATAHATWSPQQTAARSTPPNGQIPIEGAPLNRAQFKYSRAIGPTDAGLTSLLLDADVLARTDSLHDVRIANGNDRQIPYLIERRDAPLTLPLRVPGRTRGEGTHSLYRFDLPYDSLPAGTRFVITTNARVFERNATLSRPSDENRGRDREIVAAETWRSSDPESDPPPLTFTADLHGAHAVELDLDEGDNAPLPITTAELLVPSYALRFISPGGPLSLFYGSNAVGAPRYDLAILAPRLFGEPARDISLTQAAPMIATPEAGTERKIFWAVIAAAVVALLITLGRLLK